MARLIVDVKDGRSLVANTLIRSFERHCTVYLILIAFVPDLAVRLFEMMDFLQMDNPDRGSRTGASTWLSLLTNRRKSSLPRKGLNGVVMDTGDDKN